ncbi:MAG: hypothetical protein L0332_33530 [Chloroflexi bacterium]|nr:hypothetical protein [Chloroflexota bacterium]
MTTIRMLVTEARFVRAFNRTPTALPLMELGVNLHTLSPAARRLALGLAATAPADPGSLAVVSYRDGLDFAIWEWDTLPDTELPEDYLERHAGLMKQAGAKVVILALEPSWMTPGLAKTWAQQLGFDIPYPTVRHTMKSGSGRRLLGDGWHISPSAFFDYLQTWQSQGSEPKIRVQT